MLILPYRALALRLTNPGHDSRKEPPEPSKLMLSPLLSHSDSRERCSVLDTVALTIFSRYFLQVMITERKEGGISSNIKVFHFHSILSSIYPLCPSSIQDTLASSSFSRSSSKHEKHPPTKILLKIPALPHKISRESKKKTNRLWYH